MKHWIAAARPKTLPLAVSGIIAGSALAGMHHQFHIEIFIPAFFTAILLQILSNFANDYGDYKKGTDQLAGRDDRMLSSGNISEKSMRNVLILFSILAMISGSFLLYVSGISLKTMLIFYGLGLAAIVSAIKYTVGKNAFAYSGLGDFFVLAFFGFASVAGVFYLHTGEISYDALWAATGFGLLATGVLNINNTRDIENDKISNKNTIPVRLGRKKATIYQLILCVAGFCGLFLGIFYKFYYIAEIHSSKFFGLIGGIFFPIVLLLLMHIKNMWDIAKNHASKSAEENRISYNGQLKFLSLTTLGASFVYALIAFLYA